MDFTNNKFNKKSDLFGISSYGGLSFMPIDNMLYLKGYRQYSTDRKMSTLDVFQNKAITLYYDPDIYLLTLNYAKELYSNNHLRYENSHMRGIYRRHPSYKSSAVMNMPYELVFNPESQYDATTLNYNEIDYAQFDTLALQYSYMSGEICDIIYGFIEGRSLGYNELYRPYKEFDNYPDHITTDRFKLFKNYTNILTTNNNYPTYISHKYSNDNNSVSRIQTSIYDATNIDIEFDKAIIPILQTIDPVTEINKSILFNYAISNWTLTFNLSTTNSSIFDPYNPKESIINHTEYSVDIVEMFKPYNVRTYISNMLKSEDLDKLNMREIYLPLFSTNRMLGYSILDNTIEFDKVTKNILSMETRTDSTESVDIEQYYITQVKFKLNELKDGSWLVRSEFLNIYCTSADGGYLSIDNDNSGTNYPIAFVQDKSYTITVVTDGRNEYPQSAIYLDGKLIYTFASQWALFKNRLTSFRNIDLEYFYFTEVLIADAESVGINSIFDVVDADTIQKITEHPYDHNPLFLIYTNEVYSYSKYLDNRYDVVISNITDKEYNIVTDIPNDGTANAAGLTIDEYYTILFNATPAIIKFKLNLDVIDQFEDIKVISMQSSLQNVSGRYVEQLHNFTYSEFNKISLESLIYEYNGAQYYIHNIKGINQCVTSLYKIDANDAFLLIDQVYGLHDMIPINVNVGNMFIYSDVEHSQILSELKPISNMGRGMGSYHTNRISDWVTAATISNYTFDNTKEYTIIYEMGNMYESNSLPAELFTVDGYGIKLSLTETSSNIFITAPLIGTFKSINLLTFDVDLSMNMNQFIIYIKNDSLEIYVNRTLIYSGNNHYKYASNGAITLRLCRQSANVKDHQIYESIVDLETLKDPTITDENYMLLNYSILSTSPLFDSLNIVSAYDYSSWDDISGNDRTLTGPEYYEHGGTLSDGGWAYMYIKEDIEYKYLSGEFRSVTFTDKIETNPIKLNGKGIPLVPKPSVNSSIPMGVRPIVNANEIIFYNDNSREIVNIVHASEFNYNVEYIELNLADPVVLAEFPQEIIDEALNIYEVRISITQLLTSMNIKSDFVVNVLPEFRTKGYLYDEPTYVVQDVDDGINPIIPAMTLIHSYESKSLAAAIANNTEALNSAFKEQIISYILLPSITAMIDNDQGIGAAAQLINDINLTDDTDISSIVSTISNNSSFLINDNIITFTANIVADDIQTIFSNIIYSYEPNVSRTFTIDLVNGVTDFTDVRTNTVEDCEDNYTTNNFTISVRYVATNSIDSTASEIVSSTNSILSDLKFDIPVPRIVPDLYTLPHSRIYSLQASTMNYSNGGYKDIVFKIIVTDVSSKLITKIKSYFKFEVKYLYENKVYEFDFQPCDMICNSGPYRKLMISPNNYTQRDTNTTDLYMN